MSLAYSYLSSGAMVILSKSGLDLTYGGLYGGGICRPLIGQIGIHSQSSFSFIIIIIIIIILIIVLFIIKLIITLLFLFLLFISYICKWEILKYTHMSIYMIYFKVLKVLGIPGSMRIRLCIKIFSF